MLGFDDDGEEDEFARDCRVFGELVAAGREALEMSQEELARIAHASIATVRRIEGGELRPFTIGTIERIADAVDVEFDLTPVPRFEELAILASTTTRPIHVFAGTRRRFFRGGLETEAGRTDGV